MVISTFVQQPLSLSDIRRLILTPPRRITAGISCFSPGKGETTEPSSTAGTRRKLVGLGIGIIASSFVTLQDANATRVEYYATVGEPSCELTFAKSGLGYCDTKAGTGVEPPIGELINIHYTARFADGTVFDSSYKRGRPLTMRIGVGKVLPGLDQGIMGGADVPPMFVGGKRRLQIPPKLAYGPEPAGCFSGDCNIPANATLFYDILFVGIYK
ncbi:Peptidyl-prolyl cis-trans isomerase [Zostera marina]|uniref:peptidylprolyl isomerase n=1 Tax=Zostera marina TaxID=29655 RepID=A0A0K9PJ81_ZOSMR|nr:Peptidyl-prolyl cis-trans isomerase [Zostera marina]